MHQLAPLLQRVGPPVGLFGLVADHMRERRLRDLPREMRFVARPIAERAAKAVDGHPFNAEPRQNLGQNLPGPVAPSTSKPDPVSATDAWDALQVGSYVVGKYWTSDGEPYGWWLGIIAGIDKNDFVIRWPDEPRTPPLKIERKHVAILHPAFDVTREWERRR